MRSRILIALLSTVVTVAAGAKAADIRIESEFKLSVPNDKREEVRRYLNARYRNGEDLFLKEHDPSFHTEISKELFIDVYFDTPSLDLLERDSGIRRRSRFFPDDPSHRKNGRSLVQMKLKRPGDSVVNRSEIKFKVKEQLDVGEGNDGSPVDLIRKPKDRRKFEEYVRDLGLDASDLRPVLTLRQTRRRIYISNSQGPFATITLDEVTAEAGNEKAEATEVELELNEKRYTAADSGVRGAMEAVNQMLKNDLLEEFSFIEVDQTPKYNKAAKALGISSPDSGTPEPPS